jgi:hypothetical protein
MAMMTTDYIIGGGNEFREIAINHIDISPSNVVIKRSLI